MSIPSTSTSVISASHNPANPANVAPMPDLQVGQVIELERLGNSTYSSSYDMWSQIYRITAIKEGPSSAAPDGAPQRILVLYSFEFKREMQYNLTTRELTDTNPYVKDLRDVPFNLIVLDPQQQEEDVCCYDVELQALEVDRCYRFTENSLRSLPGEIATPFIVLSRETASVRIYVLGLRGIRNCWWLTMDYHYALGKDTDYSGEYPYRRLCIKPVDSRTSMCTKLTRGILEGIPEVPSRAVKLITAYTVETEHSVFATEVESGALRSLPIVLTDMVAEHVDFPQLPTLCIDTAESSFQIAQSELIHSAARECGYNFLPIQLLPIQQLHPSYYNDPSTIIRDYAVDATLP